MSDIRENLRRLVDQLPETEALAALRYLEYLRDRGTVDPLLRALAEAPIDDEPLTPEELQAVQEADEAIARGEVLSWEESKRLLGGDE